MAIIFLVSPRNILKQFGHFHLSPSSDSLRVAVIGMNNNSYNASKLQSSAAGVRPGSGEGQTSQGVVTPRRGVLGAAFTRVLVTWSSLHIPVIFATLLSLDSATL